MTNRVLLGKKGAAYGLWVSKPGVNVLTAGIDDMLLSTERQAFQIVRSGVVSGPAVNTTRDFAIPNMGFNPVVLISSSFTVHYSFPNATTLRLHIFVRSGKASGFVRYAVTNQKINH